MSKHSSLIAVTVLALPFLAMACSSSSDSAGKGPGGRGGRGAGGPVPVLLAPVQQKDVPLTLPAVGTVEAITSVQIRAQVTGQLSAIHFTEGQDVTKGQPLFSLDARPFQAALQQAQAVLARDTASLQNALAQQARAENLFKRGLLARDQYETQQASASALTATVEADKAAVETAKVNLQYTEIKAPLSGRTGSLGAHVGDLVRSSDSTALVLINQLSPVYVTFSVPGRYLDEIRAQQRKKPLMVLADSQTDANPAGGGSPTAPVAAASTQAASDSDNVISRGEVTFIDNAVDNTTGTIRLKGTFPNPSHELWPGGFVRVTLRLSMEAGAKVVPAVAVQTSQDSQFVYVVKPDQTVEMRKVVVERQQGAEAIIASGVSGGEIVVTDGHLRLTPGARIRNAADARGEAGRGEGRGPRGGAETPNQGAQSGGGR